MLFDIRNLVVVLNGHTFGGGFSDDADAVMFEPIELVGEPRVGAGGEHAFFAAGNKGGQLTLKFLPNSPDIPFLQQQAEVVRRGGSVMWAGSVRDVSRGYSATLINGELMSYPPFPTYGRGEVSNYEYVFRFAEIESNFDTPAPGAFSAA